MKPNLRYSVHYNKQSFRRRSLNTKSQTTKNVEIVRRKEWSVRRLFNLLGIFIFGGYILAIAFNPVNELNKFLLFIFVSAAIYYFLVNIFHNGQLWRKVFYSALLLVAGVSLCMVLYLLHNGIQH